MKIERLLTCGDDFLQALEKLMPQLTSDRVIPSCEAIEIIISATATSIWVAYDENDRITGMLTLAIYQSPTGIHGWIEDVVVDEMQRGKGIGKELTLKALEFAKKQGAKAVSLTSRPYRNAANRLYRKLGFRAVETNLYRFYID
jgi:ribosomal protein S18 acetylase RimI-like enzyme